MNTLVKFGAGLIAAALCCSVGSAATLVVNCSSIGPVMTELDVNLQCPQFSLAGQTLTSIEIALSAEIGGTVSVTNNSATTQSANVTTTSAFNVTSIAGLGPGVAPESGFAWTNPVFSVDIPVAFNNILSGQSLVAPLSGTGNGSLGLDTTQFTPYLGPGLFDIHLTTLTGLSTTGGGGQLVVGQEALASAAATVTYTFVPEPSVVSLFAVGLVGLLWLHRRRALR